jgi:hypothetical protein
VRAYFRGRSKAPLAIAGLISFPLFFASLLAVSLAIDRPVAIQWRSATGRLIEVDRPPSSATEAKIWSLALVLPAILVAVGVAAILSRRIGVYLVCAAGLTMCLLLPIRLDRWVVHHTVRFPHGMDLVPDGSNSNLISRGEWEANAKATVISLTHWTIGLIAAVVVISVGLEVRRRLGPVPPAPAPPPETVTGEAAVSVPRSTLKRWLR